MLNYSIRLSFPTGSIWQHCASRCLVKKKKKIEEEDGVVVALMVEMVAGLLLLIFCRFHPTGGSTVWSVSCRRRSSRRWSGRSFASCSRTLSKSISSWRRRARSSWRPYRPSCTTSKSSPNCPATAQSASPPTSRWVAPHLTSFIYTFFKIGL